MHIKRDGTAVSFEKPRQSGREPEEAAIKHINLSGPSEDLFQGTSIRSARLDARAGAATARFFHAWRLVANDYSIFAVARADRDEETTMNFLNFASLIDQICWRDSGLSK